VTRAGDCPHCNEFRSKGARFCGACGQNVSGGAITDRCPRCDGYRSRGAAFCGACGRRITKKKLLDIDRNPLFTVTFFTCVLGAIILAVEFICLILSSVDVLNHLDDLRVSLILITPEVVSFYTLGDLEAKVYWIIIILALVASSVYGLIGFFKAFRTSVDDGDETRIENNGLFWASVLFGSTILITIAYNLILGLFGSGIDSSWTDRYSELDMKFMLAEAPFWEEIISRVLLIGVPMTILAILVTGKLRSLRCLLGGFEMSKVAIIFIVFSGLMFGIAHNGGWGVEKVFPTVIQGIALGYLFVRFGLYASIILHFLTDYMSSFSWLGSTAAEGAVMLLLLALGVVALAYVVKKLFRRGTITSLPLFAGWPDKKESGDQFSEGRFGLYP
jgi:hypothetical protein